MIRVGYILLGKDLVSSSSVIIVGGTYAGASIDLRDQFVLCLIKYDLDRSTAHSKFDLAEV